jgi:hypothetical protein
MPTGLRNRFAPINRFIGSFLEVAGADDNQFLRINVFSERGLHVLPVGVRPRISKKSSFQAKCRDQNWRRGSKSGTSRPVSGSRA